MMVQNCVREQTYPLRPKWRISPFMLILVLIAFHLRKRSKARAEPSGPPQGTKARASPLQPANCLLSNNDTRSQAGSYSPRSQLACLL